MMMMMTSPLISIFKENGGGGACTRECARMMAHLTHDHLSFSNNANTVISH